MTAWVVSCEHATHSLPPGWNPGVDPERLQGHEAWDPGAAPLAASLAQQLRAPLYLGRVTRLFVDLNRRAESAGVIPRDAFGLRIPANLHLTRAQRDNRLAAYHAPFRAAVHATVSHRIATAHRCAHLSAHSFTPVGKTTPPHVGVLFDPARPWEVDLAERALDALRARGWDARPNDPYLGTDDGLTTWLRERFPSEGYAGLEIEVRQGSDLELAVADTLAATFRDL